MVYSQYIYIQCIYIYIHIPTLNNRLTPAFKAQPRFGVFLCDGEFGEQSEVSFGGFDPRRILAMGGWGWVFKATFLGKSWEKLEKCLGKTVRSGKTGGHFREMVESGNNEIS